MWNHQTVLGNKLTRSGQVASLVAQTVKNLPAMQETWVWSSGQEDPLEKDVAAHSSILAWENPWAEKAGGHSPRGREESGTTEWLTHTHTHTHTHGWWRASHYSGNASSKEPACRCRRHKKMWAPSLRREDPLEGGMVTQCSILAWRSLVGYSPWGHKELDMTEAT